MAVPTQSGPWEASTVAVTQTLAAGCPLASVTRPETLAAVARVASMCARTGPSPAESVRMSALSQDGLSFQERLLERARRSSRAGAEELPASLVHSRVSEVSQNDEASRWSWVTPTAGSERYRAVCGERVGAVVDNSRGRVDARTGTRSAFAQSRLR